MKIGVLIIIIIILMTKKVVYLKLICSSYAILKTVETGWRRTSTAMPKNGGK